MVVIRPIQIQDHPQLFDLAELTNYGLTTLPRDEALLEQRIEQSMRSFAAPARRPGGEKYLFVLAEAESARIFGTTGINSKAGGFEPNWGYQIQTVVHESKMLGVRKEIQTLHLVAEHDGPCEIGSLFLAPEFRKPGYGRLLSLCRFLFIAEFPHAFDPTIMAELRGVIDDEGRSPFWDAIGQHFFDIDFPSADYLSMVNKKFIAELMPKHPIYVCLLPRAAQEVIGKTHTLTTPARKLLEGEGFKYGGMVDIFEAGPYMACPRDQVRAIRDSRRQIVGGLADEPLPGPDRVIGSTNWDFRACIGPVQMLEDGTVRIERKAAEALNVHPGQAIRHVELKGGHSQS